MGNIIHIRILFLEHYFYSGKGINSPRSSFIKMLKFKLKFNAKILSKKRKNFTQRIEKRKTKSSYS